MNAVTTLWAKPLRLALCAGLLASAGGSASSATSDYFKITVVDEQTGRGVPLVELRAVGDTAWWTDSNGIIAFLEPGLMDGELFFHVRSHGYEYAKDFFGNRGLKLVPQAGASAIIKIKRLNIAERLYRMTGQGIYRDSVLVGHPVPLREPLLNGQVMGQDTVIATPYRGKIYWFWGDTERPSYPLGNFGTSGATSEWPDHGGLDPTVGVNLTYFTDASGFSKPMCPTPNEGLRWIEGVFTLPDANGVERLVARMARHRDLGSVFDWHLMVFNDGKQEFESIVRWDIRDGHDSAHPFRARVGTNEYLYLYPNYRVQADWPNLRELKNYEAFTCVSGDGRQTDTETTVDRDAQGRARYSWKAGADRLHPGRLRELVKAGKLKTEEPWLRLRDIETGKTVEPGRGSVFWNDYRQRWIMLTSAKAGEIWFAEADTPVGPWAYSRRVVSHDRYNFYNPTQHPFFDQDGGRLIYFEGTYTASFSAAPTPTPRYNYNQIMYRLALDDVRLALPAPVYRLTSPDGRTRYAMREVIERSNAWDQVVEIAFYAVPPWRQEEGLLSVSVSGTSSNFVFTVSSNTPSSESLFLALPAESQLTSVPDDGSSIAPLFEFRQPSVGLTFYTTRSELNDPSLVRSPRPLCRVWKNPSAVLALDSEAKPLPIFGISAAAK